MPLAQAIPLGLQHVLAMFVGNLTPLLIVTSACGLAGAEFADVQLSLLQNAMWIAGVVTLIQLFRHWPRRRQRCPSSWARLQETSSACSTRWLHRWAAALSPMAPSWGASLIGGLFEAVLGFFLKPLRRFFPAVVTGTVVLSIGLKPYQRRRIERLRRRQHRTRLRIVRESVLGAYRAHRHSRREACDHRLCSASSILAGIIVGYVVAGIMGLVLPTTGVTADGVEYKSMGSELG